MFLNKNGILIFSNFERMTIFDTKKSALAAIKRTRSLGKADGHYKFRQIPDLFNIWGCRAEPR